MGVVGEAPSFGHTELPAEQQDALRRAVRVAWLSIAFLTTAVVLMYVVMGSSQAMKAAWAEDLLSFIPPVSFLIAARVARRAPTARHPYGYHRSVGIGHLVAATTLLAMGVFLVVDSGSGLVSREHPPVGVMVVAGHPVWSGWLMCAALAYTAVPPVLLGTAKMPLARTLHDRVLHADAKMNKADWMTAVAGIVGVVGIGVGVWWADAVAAVVIAVSILRDGWSNLLVAVDALADARAATVDGHDPDPLVARVDGVLADLPWAATAGSRIRDQGHVFHVEGFVVPHNATVVGLDDLERARVAIGQLDWRLQDVVITLVRELPEEFRPQHQRRDDAGQVGESGKRS